MVKDSDVFLQSIVGWCLNFEGLIMVKDSNVFLPCIVGWCLGYEDSSYEFDVVVMLMLMILGCW